MASDTMPRKTFYVSFGAGYRRTEFSYDDMGVRARSIRHPVFPDKIDGRGYVEVEAYDQGRARYLTSFFFKNQFSGCYETPEMWEEWEKRDGYESSPRAFRRENGGTLLLGRLDEDGLHWPEVSRGR